LKQHLERLKQAVPFAPAPREQALKTEPGYPMEEDPALPARARDEELAERALGFVEALELRCKKLEQENDELKGANSTLETRARYLEGLMQLLDRIGVQMAPMTAPSALADQIVSLAVPLLGDLCIVTLDARTDAPAYSAIAHIDRAQQTMLQRLGARFWALPGVRPAVRRARAARMPVIESRFNPTDPFVSEFDTYDLLDARQLGIKSLIVVPLIGRDDVLGLIALATRDARPPYREEDLPIVADLGRRAALAIDNGRLFRQLHESNLAKDQFIAMLSHELRTPLTPVLAAVSALLASQSDLPARDLRPTLEMIRRNVELEARIIDDLLDLSRVEHGQFRLDTETVDAHSMVALAVDICRRDAHDKRIDITADLSVEKHHVRGDPARLQQIVWNLVKNAVKFTPIGGTVRVRSRADASRFYVEVSDTGIGIEPAQLSRIFDAFAQVNASVSRRFGGFGLGLTISRTLAEAHGGKLRAMSDGPGKGSTFTLELPIAAAPTQDAATFASVPNSVRPELAITEPASLPVKPEQPPSILLVEDDADTLEVVAGLLEEMGYCVEKAQSVASALACASNQSFDLLVSDIGLPDGSGLEIMQHVRARGVPTKGVALSGYGTDDDVRRAKQVGFSAHLTKPVSMTKLAAILDELTHRA
jgi:signal transduction histidine kinase